jgi:hypothetical protein
MEESDMTPRKLIPWLLLALLLGVAACSTSEAIEVSESSHFQIMALDDDVCDPIEPDYDPNDPRCKPEGPGGTGVVPPTECIAGAPTCVRAQDYPSQFDLSGSNSENVLGQLDTTTSTYSLKLIAGSAVIVDSDGDGVPDDPDDCEGTPDWRAPCDGDPSNDGIYQTLFFNTDSDVTVRADIDISGKITKADAYILMDSTGSMRGEQLNLIKDLTTGTFIDTSTCASGAGTGLVGALKCSIPDLWLGLGDFKEVSYLPHNDYYDMTPYHHYLDTTDNVQHVIDAVSSLVVDSNKDLPEATSQALYSVVTGQGLGDLVPNRGSCPSTPAGRWGYPCFRPNVLPIILLFTDADMFNGPVANGHTYGNPPFDGTVGLGSMLPPVEQSPNVLYANDPGTAWYLGDMTDRSMTVMGTNTNLGNNKQTWDQGACRQCDSMGLNCWSDGRDSFIGFSLTAPRDFFLSGQGTSYHTHNVALFDSALGLVDCNPGPGGGDYWGRFNATVGAGDWYTVSDASVATNVSAADRVGNYQLRFHNVTADGAGDPASWMTRDLPIAWTDVETELLATGVKIVSVISPNSGGYIAIPDVTEIQNITGSVDQNGDPYMEIIQGDGTGLSTALLDAVRSLVGDTRRDITLVPEDNPTTGINETDFVTAVTATSCPTGGIQNCLGSADLDMNGTNDVCLGCLAETKVGFSFRLGNAIQAQTTVPQIFEFDMVAMADGTVELSRIPVRIMVPPQGTDYGAGFYQNEYASEAICIVPPERPDWGYLTWFGTTPSDSKIEFEFFTADTLEGLDNQVPASVVIPDDTDVSPINVGQVLFDHAKNGEGLGNERLYLRVRAKLQASSDLSETPELEGWSLQFDCVPKD